MIQLFNINPYNINTGSFNNLLHGTIVTDFEKAFCKYVGAKYGCSINSATSALFLCLVRDRPVAVRIPSMIPPVVLNSILLSGNRIEFIDDTDWIGHSYLFHHFPGYNIIDSAQQVDRNQFKREANPSDLMVFSFYPTKPVGSCDGGMIVSDDQAKIEHLRAMSMNGMTKESNSWERRVIFPGYKMYLNSIQAYIAMKNLQKLDEKKAVLKKIRDMYNRKMGYRNTSDHLYRIYCTRSNNKVIKIMREKYGIICGKHYEAAHLMKTYAQGTKKDCHLSTMAASITMSIPFHENLTIMDAYEVIKAIKTEVLS
jgi:dTDP-4-amino-4,6-dideoxygalactose transaminase